MNGNDGTRNVSCRSQPTSDAAFPHHMVEKLTIDQLKDAALSDHPAMNIPLQVVKLKMFYKFSMKIHYSKSNGFAFRNSILAHIDRDPKDHQ
jgi:hypothetical protein